MTNTNTTPAEAAASLVARANRILKAGEYLPGRPHFAAIVGAKLASVARAAKPVDGVARATVCERAMRMFCVAGDVEAYEAIRVFCIVEVLGLAFPTATHTPTDRRSFNRTFGSTH